MRPESRAGPGAGAGRDRVTGHMMTDRQGGLFRRVVKGGFWVFAFSGSQEIIAIARLVILARLLSPNDFGLAGMAILALATLDALTQMGFDVALIQKKDDARTYLDTAWTVGVLRGGAIFVVLLGAAPYVAGFFRSPEVTNLVRVIGFSILAQSFANIGVVYFRKELEFRKQFLWQFSGRLADFCVAVAVAFTLRNVWALVLAFVAGDAAKLLLSYLLHPYRPRLRIEMKRARELFRFGKWMWGSSVLVLLLTQIDNGVVGRVIGAATLGLYQLARRIANLPASEIAHVISNVTFPAYAKLQDRPEALRGAYRMVLEVTALVTLPVAGALAVLAPEITVTFFGDKWLPAAGAIRLLAVWGVLNALFSTAGQVLLAVGMPRSLSTYQLIQVITMAVLVYPMSANWGITGTSLAVALAAILPCWLALRRVEIETAGERSHLARSIAVPTAGAAFAAVAVVALKRAGILAPTATGLALALPLYALAYVILVGLAGPRLGYQAVPVLREVISAARARQEGAEEAPRST